jgi:hypothetical protein
MSTDISSKIPDTSVRLAYNLPPPFDIGAAVFFTATPPANALLGPRFDILSLKYLHKPLLLK